ncbi:hypothetical protein R6Q59_008256 [Mikania micrantha]
MANNHGGSGSKFVSVNLNKLYGQASHLNYQSHSGSYGPGVGANRARTGGPGGGMVVLSRNRPLQKAMPKLSVPPPLNLPSLRKEYEKIDSSGAGGGVSGGAGSGSGSRPTSSGMGWTKPGNIALKEKENTQVSEGTKVNGAYMPPSARHGNAVSAHHSNVEKAMVLMGEDFPSLRAVLPSSKVPTAQKHKEGSGSSQKVKQLVSEESSNDISHTSHFNSTGHIQPSHHMPNRVNENPRPNPAHMDHAQKQEDPLSLVWLNPRSDWADDERDTSRRFVGRGGSDQELPKTETYWDRDFDVPILPHKPPNNLSERHGRGSTSEVLKAEPYREINSWRNSSIYKDRSAGSHAINEGNNITVPNHLSTHHVVVTENQDSAYVRRGTGQGRQWNHHHIESPGNRTEVYQKSTTGSKSGFFLGGKAAFSKSERTYLDDSYQKDLSSGVYDERDPFTGNFVGVLKRKKGVIEHTDFHDPVRESFEAELERVQKMQEMERQRIVDEQERALEQARREDKERRREILEEEEKQRRIEEEAREAAWRAEQERLDAVQKAEQQKIAREEERRRIVLEDERRKQAAKQKLLDLEARMAKRNAEVGKTGADPVGVKDSDISMDSVLDSWEVGQRMVERITISASSDSSAMDRPFDQPQLSSEVPSMERGKPVNPWIRETFEVGSNSSFLLNDLDNGHHSPRRDTPTGRKALPRKELFGGGYMSRSSDTDGFSNQGDRGNKWNSFGDGEVYGRNREIETEFYDSVGEKYGEVGWGQDHSHNNTRSYSDRFESDKLYSYGRSRYSIKQPRVLPPPSLSSVPRSSMRAENELSAPSSSLESTARTGNYDGPQDNLQQSELVDIQQEIIPQKNVTLRCDSQSSLSVSSPPSSPTHLSHDELDVDSGGCSVTHIGGEGMEVNDESGEVTAIPAAESVSKDEDEDEEWNLENHDDMQEQEEYDEDDGYGEEDEVLEGPDDNIDLTQEFEHLQIEEKSTTDVMENLILGFDEGVEVGIPGDEFEKDSKTDGSKVDILEVSVGVVEKQTAVDAGIHEHEQMQNAYTSTSSSHLGDQVSSSAEMTYVSSAGQFTTPVELQFGLFSRPTLIQSPVPAIQIGSIQMPLHIHPPVGTSLGHLHPSQPPPLFQFGQLIYSSPVSKGILPMTQRSISLVQPNFHPTHSHFNLDQNSEGFLPNQLSQEISAINMKKDTGSANLISNHGNFFHSADNITANKPVIHTEEQGLGTSNDDSQLQFVSATSQGPSAEKNVPLSKAPGPSNRAKRSVHPARNSGPRPFQAYEPMGSNELQRKHRRSIQRVEFRVRENYIGLDDKLNNKTMGTSTRSGYRRQMGPTASLKRVVPEAGIISESRPGKETARTKTQTASSSVESNLNRNIPEEDVDAPLQSGVVRVFKQPGIECLSDEDDFIEVRSKRQMLNDRREQREKEIKAKSRATKPRKAHVISSGHMNKTSAALVGETSSYIRSDGGLVKKEQTVEFSTMASQSIAPIGTASVDTDVQIGIRLHASKPLQIGSAFSGAAEDHGSNYMFETENKVADDVQTPGEWGPARLDQQFIPLTQIQLDEAMKPSRVTTADETSIGDQTTLDNEPILPSSLKGKSVPSSSSPINSLLAGEKIQFGAVTSPTMLPPTSRVVSHSVGAPGSFHSDVTQSTQNISKVEHNYKHSTDDCETEVEAVAVAAIDTDEIVGTKNFGGAVEVIQGGLAVDQQSGSQSKPEEALSVSLPADLSVEMPPMSLWPPQPSPQGSSTQMISHFPGATPSHFPLYDMNHPMMSSPVFAFGRHDESGGTQSQSKKPTGVADSRHIGAWQNHSGIDTFYGTPAGFSAPFIGAPGGMPGVQAAPHMVVYNHYSPVGQFGQVGLSFMGTTYIPSGKQPDWKHDPTSSSRSEEDMRPHNSLNNNMQPPIQQHLAPGSPLLPMTMFDVPPFQAAPDMSVQARWSHMPASSHHAVPMSPPLPQHAEVITGPSHFSSHGGHPVDQSTFRLHEPQASSPSVVVIDSSITHFPDELGLLDSSMSTTSPVVAGSHISSGTTKTGEGGAGISNVELKNQHQQGKNLHFQQYNDNSNYNNNHGGGGYGYQRGGGVSPKNKSLGGQWPHRRSGFHGRYHPSLGAEKSFPSSTRVKQIYVAKQAAASGGSSF